MFSDVQVGRLLDAIDALPAAVRDRTMVLVTADHGEAFGEHGMAWHGVELWDELVRVPLLLRVPGSHPRTVTTRRSQIDLLPPCWSSCASTLPRPTPPTRSPGCPSRGTSSAPRPPRGRCTSSSPRVRSTPCAAA